MKEEKKSRIDQLHKLHSENVKAELFNNHFDFQGGVLQYHQWITALFGGLLFLLTFAFQQGAWIYFYLLGMIKVVKDTVKTTRRSDQTGWKAWNWKPLTYYLISALLVTVVMVQAGHQFPDMTLGLAESTMEVLP